MPLLSSSEPPELPELAQQLEVLLGRLAEAEARVDDQVLPGDAEAAGAIQGCAGRYYFTISSVRSAEPSLTMINFRDNAI